MQNISKDQKLVHYTFARGICNYEISKVIKRMLIMSQTTFRDCRVHFCAFFPTTFLEMAVYT